MCIRDSYKAKRVKTRCYQEGIGQIEPRFQGEGVVPEAAVKHYRPKLHKKLLLSPVTWPLCGQINSNLITAVDCYYRLALFVCIEANLGVIFDRSEFVPKRIDHNMHRFRIFHCALRESTATRITGHGLVYRLLSVHTATHFHWQRDFRTKLSYLTH